MVKRSRRAVDVRRANLAFTSEETESVCAIVSSHTHDERLSQSIQFSPTIISHIRRLLQNGGSIITDTELLARSISELPGMAENDKVNVRCFIDDPEVIVRAVNMHVTRAEVALDMALAETGSKLIVIGSAPAALSRLLAHRQHEPLTDVGVLCTVNAYSAAIQLKERLRECDLCYIVTRGRMGGTIAAGEIFSAVLEVIREKG